MTAIQLYKFISDNNVEWRYQDNDGTEDVIVFINNYILDEFTEMIEHSTFDEGGVEVTLFGGYIAIWMGWICGYNDIDMKEVFVPEKDN